MKKCHKFYFEIASHHQAISEEFFQTGFRALILRSQPLYRPAVRSVRVRTEDQEQVEGEARPLGHETLQGKNSGGFGCHSELPVPSL